MKKSFSFKVNLLQILLIVIIANIHVASRQSGKENPSQIPEDINKIFQTSCMPCHGTNGRPMAMAKINFSGWAEYDNVKQAEKAGMICTAIIKESMPPRSVTKSKPELIPTKENIELICKWAESIKPNEVEK